MQSKFDILETIAVNNRYKGNTSQRVEFQHRIGASISVHLRYTQDIIFSTMFGMILGIT
jgi:hypothetical protein